MKLLTSAVLAAMLAATAADAAQLMFFWRSPTTGKIVSNTVTVPPPVDPDPVEPTEPTGFRVSIAGAQSVARYAIVDLSPIVEDGSGAYVYSYLGQLPTGVTFSASTGRFSGPALNVGTFQVWLEVLDTGTGQSTSATINLIVT